MSDQWAGLLPDMNNEFFRIAIERREPTAAESERLMTLEKQAGENCQVILRGLAAVGAAPAEAHAELSPVELNGIGYLTQYLANLGADLAHIEAEATSYLRKPAEVSHV